MNDAKREANARKISAVLEFLAGHPVAVARVERYYAVARRGNADTRPQLSVYSPGDLVRWYNAAINLMTRTACTMPQALSANWPVSRATKPQTSSPAKPETPVRTTRADA